MASRQPLSRALLTLPSPQSLASQTSPASLHDRRPNIPIFQSWQSLPTRLPLSAPTPQPGWPAWIIVLPPSAYNPECRVAAGTPPTDHAPNRPHPNSPLAPAPWHCLMPSGQCQGAPWATPVCPFVNVRVPGWHCPRAAPFPLTSWELNGLCSLQRGWATSSPLVRSSCKPRWSKLLLVWREMLAGSETSVLGSLTTWKS